MAVFLVVLFVSYYAFLGGSFWTEQLFALLPFRDEAKEHIASKLRSISYAIFVGSFFIALLEGVLGFLAFFLIGNHAPLFLGVLIAVTALIPFVSATAIWLPALLYHFYLGELWSVFILLFFGLLLFYVDNFLRSSLAGRQAQVHPLLILLGILGGVNLLGFVGLVLGPFILSFSLLLLKLYLAERA